MEVDAVNKGIGYALTNDGKTIPITDCLDADGEPCESDDAVSVVAGPDADGKWWHIILSEYDQSMH